nr:EFR1 family ferrodoxin [uncultured Methanospirillum sp.]
MSAQHNQPPLKIDIWYFSATGNTARIAGVIKEEYVRLGADATLIDITPYTSRNAGVIPGSGDVVVLGLPVHSWRAPRVVREWLATLQGHGKKIALFFTYGGFGIHPAHETTRSLLENQGFSVVASAEFCGSHTFNLGGWKAMEGRPDQSDLEIARAYAEQVLCRFTGEDCRTLGEMERTSHSDEFLDSIEEFRFRILTQMPARQGSCTDCGSCVRCCPTGSMDPETGRAGKDSCIACLACVVACPDHLISINDMSESWSYKLRTEGVTEEEMRKKKSRFYL